MKRCTVKTRHVPGSRAERECEVHGVGMRPRSAAAAAPPPPPPVVAREPEVEVGHLEDGPAAVYYRPDGTVKVESWRLHGDYHRVDGPAVVAYREDGTVEAEWWYLAGKLHREDGPAYVKCRPDGTVEREEWYLDGKLHRVSGPADVWYRPDGTVLLEKWHLGHKRVPRERVAAAYLSEHFEPVSEINTGAIDMLLAQGPLTALSAEQVRLALTLYPEL